MALRATDYPRRRRSIVASLFALVAAIAFCLLYSANRTNNTQQYTSYSSLRNYNPPTKEAPLDKKQRRRRLSIDLNQFTDPKSVTLRSDADAPNYQDVAAATQQVSTPQEHFTPIDHVSRQNCQIVYILGVEGATHHGFMPIIENLGKHQGDGYRIDTDPRGLKAGLFGWFYHAKIKSWGFKVTPSVDDPEFIKHVVADSCPNDGKKHVLMEWASFPSGHEDDPRTYRVHRQHEWLGMTPEEVANSDEALSHPTSMNAFYTAYSPFVDIKFVVLHRPFLETIASHRDWDGGPEIHSNIIRGFMLMLRRFLDTHLFDVITGKRLWHLVCVERIMAKNYEGEEETNAARARILGSLAEFLGWPDGDCPHCFDDWRDSSKDPIETLGEENMPVMLEHMKWLEGIWPPPGEQGVEEQQCGI
mmetsp:Transcript_39818/g.67903  ORF Transcript_39818/g.67903 Transcript_39818/m.67903 type:complete len:417 (+) Transcript_39818:168-1418(+)